MERQDSSYLLWALSIGTLVKTVIAQVGSLYSLWESGFLDEPPNQATVVIGELFDGKEKKVGSFEVTLGYRLVQDKLLKILASLEKMKPYFMKGRGVYNENLQVLWEKIYNNSQLTGDLLKDALLEHKKDLESQIKMINLMIDNLGKELSGVKSFMLVCSELNFGFDDSNAFAVLEKFLGPNSQLVDYLSKSYVLMAENKPNVK